MAERRISRNGPARRLPKAGWSANFLRPLSRVERPVPPPMETMRSGSGRERLRNGAGVDWAGKAGPGLWRPRRKSRAARANFTKGR